MDKDRIVAGLDIHKDTIYLCVMDNTETVIFANVYGTLTPNLQLMCSDMVSHGVTEVAMESTSTYWVPVWNALCERMSLTWVNPYFIKQVPGRKSDVSGVSSVRTDSGTNCGSIPAHRSSVDTMACRYFVKIQQSKNFMPIGIRPMARLRNV